MFSRAQRQRRPDSRSRRRRSVLPHLEALEIRATPSATQLVVVSSPPADITAGQAFGVTFAAEDSSGDVVPSFSGTVTLALANNPGGGILGGTTTATFSNGLASFSDLALDKSGVDYSLLAASNGLSPPPSSSLTFDVTAAAPSQLVVTSPPPATITAGQAFGLTAAVEDQYDNLEEGFSGNLAVAPTNSSAEGPLGGILTVAVADGQATFSGLTLEKPGSALTLQVSASGFSNATTSPFSVLAAPATQLVVTTAPPALVTAGSSFGLVLAAEDPYGNINPSFAGNASIALDNNPTGDTLVGTTTLAFSGGLATFTGLTLQKVGSDYTLEATAAGLTSPSPSALAFSVEPVATRLVVTNAPPGAVIAGQPFGLTVSAEDAFGNVDTAYNGTATLTMGTNPGNGILSGTATVSFSGGMASFSGLSVNQPGVGYTLEASSNGLSSAATPGFNITSPLTQLVVTSPPPSNVVAGQAFTISLAAEDSLGNVDATFNGTATASIVDNPGGGILLGQSSASFSNGLASFTGLTLDAAGTGYSILLASNGLASAVPITLTFNVTPAAASQLAVTSPPPSAVDAGQAFGLSVAVEDQYGNVVTGYSGNLAVAPSSAAEGSLEGSLTVPVADGAAAFAGLSLTRPGTNLTLQVSGTGLTTATTSPFTVSAGAATQLVVTAAPPADVAAGVGFGLTLAAEDQYGNIDPNFKGTAALTLSGGPGPRTLVGTTTLPFNGGVATFAGLTLTAAGSGYAFQAASSGLTSPPSSALAFGVTAGAATQLAVVSPPPAEVTAGVGFGLTLAAEDQYGNVDPAFAGGVTLALTENPGADTLGGVTNLSFSNGLAIFTGLTLNNASSVPYTLQATSNGLAPTPSLGLLSFQVAAAPADRLVVLSPPPANITEGTSFGLTLAAEDPFGNVDTAFGGTVALALASNPGGTTLGGVTNVSFSNGLATFTGLTLSVPGTGYSILAASNGLVPPSSADAMTFNVTSTTTTSTGTGSTGSSSTGTGSTGSTGSSGTSSGTTGTSSGTSDSTLGVAIYGYPTAVVVGQTFQLSAVVEESGGVDDTGFSGTVTLSLVSNPGGAALGGNLTMPVIHGVVTFYDLSLSAPASGYIIRATASGADPATSSPITVTDPPASLLITGPPPSSVAAGQAFGLTVAVVDTSGNRDSHYDGSVTIAWAGKHGKSQVRGTLTATAVNGVATFSGLTFGKALKGYALQLKATASGLLPAMTDPISVSLASHKLPRVTRISKAHHRA